MRCAIYFVPPPDAPLTVAAAQWLRRDVYTGGGISSEIEGLTERDHAFLTALPRRYGFHATFKAPFHLADGRSVHELERQLKTFCGRVAPLTLTVRLALVDSFFAIVPVKADPDLDMLAARVVTEFDAFRSPLTEIDIARRDVSRLSGRQLANLMTWGYPHVFDQFRFHMSLTGPIDHLERDHVMTVLTRHFGDFCAGTLEIDQLVLIVEPEPHAPFIVHSSHRFGVRSEGRRAI
jgi:putative phosphonate metabolism protein